MIFFLRNGFFEWTIVENIGFAESLCGYNIEYCEGGSGEDNDVGKEGAKVPAGASGGERRGTADAA